MRMMKFVCLFLAAFMSLVGPARGAVFPSLFGPTAYSGDFTYDGNAYSVLLILGENQKFLLKENFVLPNGKHSGWEVVGKWHQIRNRAFLQLSRQDGFLRLANVGGSGNVYLGVQFPGGQLTTISLRAKPLNDCAEELERLALNDSVNPETPPEHTLDIAVGYTWKVSQFGGGAFVPRHAPPYMLSFLPSANEQSGEIEFFDGMRHGVGRYALRGSELILSATTQEGGFARLIQETKSWNFAGEVLELWGKDRLLAVLEKTR